MSTTPNKPAIPEEIYAIYCGGIDQASAQKVVNSLTIAMGAKAKHIHLLFQSAGGYVGDGVFLYNLFRSVPIELTLYNVGQIASCWPDCQIINRHNLPSPLVHSRKRTNPFSQSDILLPEDLQRQIGQDMIARRQHTTDCLAILNYTQKAQYTPELWTETTDKCRGLIYNPDTLEIHARPFVKFWNYADSRHPETLPGSFPLSVPMITRKMDGSLGIGYWSGDRLCIATRGSFESEQAKWATKWMETRQPCKSETKPGYTFLFEIIYPENQIVVKYDWQGLILLGIVNNETGDEVGRNVLEDVGLLFGWRVVDAFDKPLFVCVEEDEDNQEGYVASWERPGTWPLRVKIKFNTYCRLHKLLTQTSPKSIWEMLRDGMEDELEKAKQNAPEDFVRWVGNIELSLRNDYKLIENAALTAMLEYGGEKNISTPEQRKQFALYATTKQLVTPLLFSMLDGKDYAPIIWKMIRPKADSVFKVDEEG